MLDSIPHIFLLKKILSAFILPPICLDAIKLFQQQGLVVTPAPTGYTADDNEPIAQWLPKASALDKSSMALKEHLGRTTIK